MSRTLRALVFVGVIAVVSSRAQAADIFDQVDHHYVDNGGVKIHYVTRGAGPLIVMLHGFPDFWYGWRDQIAALSRHYLVAALDLRGYNLSDKPHGVGKYNLGLLAADVAAVVNDLGRDQAIVVGHDWGAAIAWIFASVYPELTSRLIVMQIPHPRGMLRELRTNPEQQMRSGYARAFQEEGSHLGLTPGALAAWVKDPVARARYREAFRQSDIEAMVNYYKASYPREPYADVPLPNIQAPVLIIHGLDDPFIVPAGHNSCWQWIDAPVTLKTVPGVGHFIHQDASALVTRTIRQWLRDTPRR